MTTFRAVTVLLIGLFFGRYVRVWAYRTIMGYQIDKSCKIGVCFIKVTNLHLEAGSRIGHFTIIRNLDLVHLSTNAKIGTFNWIFGMLSGSEHFQREIGRKSALIMERESSITSRHILDCTDSITVGAFSTVAGFKSQILTHGIDIKSGRQSCAPVKVGPYSMIGTSCIILKGANLPEGTILSAGSCFRGGGSEAYCLWSGTPAEVVKPLDPELKYFQRTSGAVS